MFTQTWRLLPVTVFPTLVLRCLPVRTRWLHFHHLMAIRKNLVKNNTVTLFTFSRSKDSHIAKLIFVNKTQFLNVNGYNRLFPLSKWTMQNFLQYTYSDFNPNCTAQELGPESESGTRWRSVNWNEPLGGAGQLTLSGHSRSNKSLFVSLCVYSFLLIRLIILCFGFLIRIVILQMKVINTAIILSKFQESVLFLLFHYLYKRDCFDVPLRY